MLISTEQNLSNLQSQNPKYILPLDQEKMIVDELHYYRFSGLEKKNIKKILQNLKPVVMRHASVG